MAKYNELYVEEMKTEHKDLENKDLISLPNIMIENNLDFNEAKVEQEGLTNTYFKTIYRGYTQFESEKKVEPLIWSMKQTWIVTRYGDIKSLLTFKPS